MNPKYNFTKTLFKGLAIILPVIVIGFFLYWFLNTLEATLARLFLAFFPEHYYIPGIGLSLFLLGSFFIGLLMNTSAAQRTFQAWERLLDRLPLIKTLYGAVEDIVASFSTDRTKRFNRVVLVTFKDLNIKLLGYVTREDLSVLPNGMAKEDELLVYLPMSYQIGGYMIVVPRSMVEPVNLSVEDASRLVLTAGMSARRPS